MNPYYNPAGAGPGYTPNPVDDIGVLAGIMALLFTKWGMIIAIAIVVLLIIGFLVYHFTKQHKEKKHK